MVELIKYTLIDRWMNPTFSTGYKRRLEVEDLYNIELQDSSEQLGNRLQK